MHRRPTEAEKVAWQAGLSRKSLGVKAIMVSTKQNVLVVKPHHKDAWQFPGGSVETNEDPLYAITRELKEELHISSTVEDFVLVDIVFQQDWDALILIYHYKPILDAATQIKIQSEELAGYEFVPPQEVAKRLSDYYKPFFAKHNLENFITAIPGA